MAFPSLLRHDIRSSNDLPNTVTTTYSTRFTTITCKRSFDRAPVIVIRNQQSRVSTEIKDPHVPVGNITKYMYLPINTVHAKIRRQEDNILVF
jgi:hypothetical protein